MRKISIALAFAALVSPQSWANAAEGGETAAGLVTMVPITVPIIESDRLQGTLQLALVLDAADAIVAARATQRLPVLRAAATAAALDFARLHASILTPVDAAQLDSVLSRAIRAVEPGISRVLIVEVSAKSF